MDHLLIILKRDFTLSLPCLWLFQLWPGLQDESMQKAALVYDSDVFVGAPLQTIGRPGFGWAKGQRRQTVT